MKQSSTSLAAVILHLLMLCATAAQATATAVTPADLQQYRNWIEDMKTAERGPFSRLRWFCNDGRVLEPKPYACGEQGGYQHGEWSKQTRTLRDQGYKIANLLAGVDADALIAQPDFIDDYNQMLIEKYLLAADDGWILRRAMFYRGAIQYEDERIGGRNLLVAMSAQPEWIGYRFPALRILCIRRAVYLATQCLETLVLV